MNPKNILLTGPPGCGKSTLIEKVIRRLEKPLAGFFTREIQEHGRRVGFSITTLDGNKGVLAHQTMPGRFKVGKYHVNLADIDCLAVPSMLPSKSGAIVVIDEIGKMECCSRQFKDTLLTLLTTEHRIFGSIALKGDSFLAKVKERKDVHLVHVSAKNRDRLVDLCCSMLSSPATTQPVNHFE